MYMPHVRPVHGRRGPSASPLGSRAMKIGDPSLTSPSVIKVRDSLSPLGRSRQHVSRAREGRRGFAIPRNPLGGHFLEHDLD